VEAAAQCLAIAVVSTICHTIHALGQTGTQPAVEGS
jgi:hypothetical protein